MALKQTFSRRTTNQITQNIDFEYFAPQARSVFLSGTFNNWNVDTNPLKKSKDGRWKISLPLGAGRHEYLFYVDGTWECDPNARECSPNPFGSWNCIITVS